MGKYDAAPTPAAGLIRLARQKAGLTQIELAERAKTSQQVVSAYETGRRDPTYSNLEKMIAAAGFEMRVQLEPLDPHDASLDTYLNAMPPEARAQLEVAMARRVDEARLRRIKGK